MPTPNIDLLEATMGRILAEPHNWDQGEWACGTTRCFAGHAVELAGARLLFSTEDDGREMAVMCMTEVGSWVFIEEYAIEVLGLEFDEAELLFGQGNTLDDLHRMVKDLIEQASR